MIAQYHCSVRNLCNMTYQCAIFVHLLNQYRHLFRTSHGNTTMADHFIPTTGTPVKVHHEEFLLTTALKLRIRFKPCCKKVLSKNIQVLGWHRLYSYERKQVLSEYALITENSTKRRLRRCTHYPVLMRYKIVRIYHIFNTRLKEGILAVASESY